MTADVAMVGVSKTFGDVRAVDDVSFEVEPESFLTLLGPSGCGKTTILKMIAGFELPDSGDIYIRGERVNTKPPYRRDTAMVFQSYALFPHMTVADNVAFGLRYRGVPTRDRPATVSGALEQVGLGAYQARYPSQLSGGQQQRVALARAIVTRPALLLLDEPLSNLDLRLRQQMRQELRNLQREVRITTVYVTHDQAEAFSMSTKIAVIDQGRIVQIGSPSDIYLRPASEFVLNFVGETNRFICTIVESSQSEVGVRTDRGLVFRVNSHGGDSPDRSIGARFQLFFREEQARLSRDGALENSFTCVVEAIQNLGSMQTLTVRLRSGESIRATIPTSSANTIRVGEKIFVAVHPGDCILIPLSPET